MISENFRQKFKENLGENYQYSPKVKQRLEAAEHFNRNNEPYSGQSIRKVFNGDAENEEIELAILEVYDEAMHRKNKLEKLNQKHTKLEEANR